MMRENAWVSVLTSFDILLATLWLEMYIQMRARGLVLAPRSCMYKKHSYKQGFRFAVVTVKEYI
jgi:hypothetical protein